MSNSDVPSQMGATTVVLSTDKAQMQAARKYNGKYIEGLHELYS